jgi:hypothetical protein
MDMTQRMAQLGDRVKDPVSGFTGIAVVQARWLHGCIRIGVAPETLHEGKVQEDRHFDQAQLVVVDEAVFLPSSQVEASKPAPLGAGGPSRETGNFRR